MRKIFLLPALLLALNTLSAQTNIVDSIAFKVWNALDTAMFQKTYCQDWPCESHISKTNTRFIHCVYQKSANRCNLTLYQTEEMTKTVVILEGGKIVKPTFIDKNGLERTASFSETLYLLQQAKNAPALAVAGK